MCMRGRILVIDVPELVAFMDMLLTAEGFAVEAVTSTEVARERLQSVPIDLVISDLRMWGTPPAALLGMMSNGRGGPPTIPLLVCTGAVEVVARPAEWLQPGLVEALPKPFDIEELLACVTRLMQTSKQLDGEDGQGHSRANIHP